jgi:hypothetical protein
MTNRLTNRITVNGLTLVEVSSLEYHAFVGGTQVYTITHGKEAGTQWVARDVEGTIVGKDQYRYDLFEFLSCEIKSQKL